MPAWPVTEVAEHTGFPEMLDGRVKTLAPEGSRRSARAARFCRRTWTRYRREHGIETIDLLVVNLYPFEATVEKPGCTLEDAIENIDIGGPAMVRSAAKNWNDVAVLTDASQYARRAGRVEGFDGTLGTVKPNSRSRSPRSTASRITTPPSAITCRRCRPTARGAAIAIPRSKCNARFVKLQDLRYGENPHQSAAFYRDLQPAPGSLVTVEISCKAKSFRTTTSPMRMPPGSASRASMRATQWPRLCDRQAREPLRRRDRHKTPKRRIRQSTEDRSDLGVSAESSRSTVEARCGDRCRS